MHGTCPRSAGPTDRALFAAIPLLAIASLPDAMVVPVLKGLLVDRYGASVGAAHWFLGVNILGGLLAALALRGLGSRAAGRGGIAAAAALNAALLALMAAPVGFAATLGLRFLEGAADLFVYAAIFHLVARLGPADRRGQRLGCAATCMMLGIAVGIGLGGIVGAIEPTLTLWVGAGACALAALIARVWLPARPTPDPKPAKAGSATPGRRDTAAWPVLAMHAADRGIGGLMATTVPLGLSVSLGYGPAMTGAVVGAAMLGLALGAWPAGLVADRIGWRRMRSVAALIHLVALGCLVPVATVSTGAGAAVSGLLGLAGAGLFASSLVLAGRRGPGFMGAYHAAGSLGFLLAPVVAAGALLAFGARAPSVAMVGWMLGAGAVVHGLVSGAALLATRSHSAAGHAAVEPLGRAA